MRRRPGAGSTPGGRPKVAAEPGTPRPDGTAIRLASFNVQHGRCRPGRVDVAVLARTCAALGADVLGLQEVDVGTRRVGGTDTAAEVAGATGMMAAFGPTESFGGGRYGNALLVRGSVEDLDLLALPRWPGAEARGVIVAAAVLPGGRRLSVAVCHLGLAPGEAAAQLGDVLARLDERPAPLILLGDMNLGPEQVRPPVEAAGLTLVGGPPTFPAHRPSQRIDHVALAGLVPNAVVVPRVPVSDHRPLVVEVEPA